MLPVVAPADQGAEAVADFYASLPTKRIGAGLVCRDATGRVLMVRPTYKPTWEIPGGAVEADESPAAAVAREIREELGVTLRIGRLLVIDWLPARPPKTEGLMFLFDGGLLEDEITQAFSLPADELLDWAWVEPTMLSERVSQGMAARLAAAIMAIDMGNAHYLEAGAALSSRPSN
jgi:ADP-ribose pyrophosphatase YjhB (NUDIX family)